MAKKNSLKHISIKDLERELEMRKANRIAELKKEIKSLEGEATAPVVSSKKNIARVKKSMAKTRASNEKSLKELLINASQDGKSRTTTELMSAVKEQGWETSSPKPYYVVAAALASQEKKKVFRRVSKGTYELIKAE